VTPQAPSDEILELRLRVARLEARLIDPYSQVTPMTVSAFARRVGLDRKAVIRRINNGEIVRKLGRIPPSELAKFGL